MSIELEILQKHKELRRMGKHPERLYLHFTRFRELLILFPSLANNMGTRYNVCCFGMIAFTDNATQTRVGSGIRIVCKEDYDNLAYMKWYHMFGRPMLEKAE